MAKGLANSVTKEMLQQDLRARLKAASSSISTIVTVIEPIDRKRQCAEIVTIQGGHIAADGLLYNAVNPTRPINCVITEQGAIGDFVRILTDGDVFIAGSPAFDIGDTVYLSSPAAPINLTTDVPDSISGNILQIAGMALSNNLLQISIEPPEWFE